LPSKGLRAQALISKTKIDPDPRGKAKEAKTHGRPEAVMSVAVPADSGHYRQRAPKGQQKEK
jgi:hypothetical protein